MPRTGVERTELERTVVEPMTATSSRMHVTVSREFLALLKKAKAGQSHGIPGASDEEVLTAALDLLIEKQAKRKACVPAKVKREVVKRDQGKCQWKMADGGVCGATVRLEVDHVVPRGKGGPSTVENCRILCRSHNIEAARQVYGDAHMDLFTRGGTPGRRPAGEGGRRGVRGGSSTATALPITVGLRGLLGLVRARGRRTRQYDRGQVRLAASGYCCGCRPRGLTGRSWSLRQQPLVSKPVSARFRRNQVPKLAGCFVQ